MSVLTSIAVSPFSGKFAPIPLIGEIEPVFARVAELGFDAVELHVRTPEDIPPGQLHRLLHRYNLRVSAFAPGRTYSVDGLSLIDPDPAVRQAAVARMNAFSSVASDLGASVFVGFVRGKVSTDPEQKQADIRQMAESCREVCAFAEPLGVDILMEPINRYEMDDFNTVAEALAFLEKVDMPNCRLLLDTFHMNIEEPSITGSLEVAGDRAAYIHVVDNNRWAPGFGHIDFDAVAASLKMIDFSGVLSAEILPLPDPLSGARQAIRSYRRMLEILNA